MIILGQKKEGSAVANILDKLQGKGQSDEDLKFQDQPSSQSPDQELKHLAGKMLDAIQGGDVSSLQHALAEFIQALSKNS